VDECGLYIVCSPMDPSGWGRLRLGLSRGLPTAEFSADGEFPEGCWAFRDPSWSDGHELREKKRYGTFHTR
jgi:hypothetical protein